MSKTILIAAGGTGGHIFPALAVAKQLEKSNYKVVWLGSKKGMENQVVANNNIELFCVNAVGLRGKNILQLLKAPFLLLVALLQSIKIMHSNKVDLVLAMGGFVGGIGGICGVMLRKKLIIHEQNSIAGTSNKILNTFSTISFQAFDKTLKNAITCGNPIVWNKTKKIPINAPINLLILGGSLGAKALNQVVVNLSIEVNIYHQTGRQHLLDVKKLYNDRDVRVVDFIDDMSEAYAWADVVVCRAGAMTISELIKTKSVAILVPFPFAIDDHQTKNAKILSDKDCAILLAENQLSVKKLDEILQTLNAKKINQMTYNFSQIKQYDSVKIIIQNIDKLL